MRAFSLAVTGLAFVTACGNYGTSVVEVQQPAQAASVSVRLPSASLAAGQTARAVAVIKDANGAALSGRAVAWFSSSTAVATVDETGMIDAVASGNAVVSAVADGVSGQSTLTVTPAPVAKVLIAITPAAVLVGQIAHTTVTLQDADGNALTDRAVSFQSANTAIATVASNGDVTGVSAGSTTITASSEGASSSATFAVSAPPPIPVASVAVSPTSPSLQTGQTIQLAATTRDASGNTLTGRVIVWSSSNTSIATVSSSGLVTATSAGSAQIRASSEGQTGSAALTVTPVPVASVSVSPATPSVQVGNTSQLTATTRDASNNLLTGRLVSWSSANGSVATVSSTGLVTAVGAGTTQVTATSEGKTGSATVTVTAAAPVPVATVSVSPATPTIQVGNTSQLTATTRDASNNVLTGRVVTWSSANTGVASVSASGLVTAVGAGTTQVTATSEGKTGSATVTVTTAAPVPVATVSVSPATPSLQVGNTSQLTATTRDAGNNVLTGRVVTWSSANTAVASVSASGLVTAVGAGTTQVTATSEGKTGTATVTVTAPPPPPAPVATVSVSPSTASLQVGSTTTQLTATTRDASNNVLTGRVITWSSADNNIATVNGSGLVTPVGAGTIQVTATSEGKSGSATITVSAAPPPPPPPPGGSVEPPGLTMISNRGFNSTTPTYSAGEDGWWDSDNGALAIVQDATAPQSPSNVARMTFSGGMGGGYAPSTLERQVNSTTLYVAAWIKFSPNWQSHLSGVNKILHFWIAGGNRLVITAAGYDPVGPLTGRISLQGIVSGGNNNDGGVSGTYESNLEFVRGAWTKIEVIAVANTAGAANGSVKLYLNGVLATQCSGIKFTNDSNPGWELMSWAPVWGGTGGTVTSTMYEYMDHIYISGN